MVKPIGPLCNLRCQYCFYLEKEHLFPDNENYKMKPEVLEAFVRSYIEAQPADPITFAWQGGEPTLLGVDFFRRVVALQRQYGEGRTIENAFQTNGTLLDEEWGRFLAENHFLVGLSIDGPRGLHDKYRVDRKLQPTFDQVMRGVEVLLRHKVEFNTLTCVNRTNSAKPLEVYRFLRGIGSRFLQFIPIVERRADAPARALGLDLAVPPTLGPKPPPAGEPGAEDVGGAPEEEDPRVMPWSVRPRDYGAFLIAIFNRWVENDVGRCYVQHFDVALGNWLGLPGGLCLYSETCGRALALEHDGTLYACDHYVYPDYRAGHVLDGDLAAIVDSPKMIGFGNAKRDSLPGQCRNCPVRFACHGGCPKHRFDTTADGEPGLNYLCAGYYAFFHHIDPYLRAMAELYQNRQPPALVMEMIARRQLPPPRG